MFHFLYIKVSSYHQNISHLFISPSQIDILRMTESEKNISEENPHLNCKIEIADLKKQVATLTDKLEERDKKLEERDKTIQEFRDQFLTFRSEIQENQRARKKKPKNNNTPRRTTPVSSPPDLSVSPVFLSNPAPLPLANSPEISISPLPQSSPPPVDSSPPASLPLAIEFVAPVQHIGRRKGERLRKPPPPVDSPPASLPLARRKGERLRKPTKLYKTDESLPIFRKKAVICKTCKMSPKNKLFLKTHLETCKK